MGSALLSSVWIDVVWIVHRPYCFVNYPMAKRKSQIKMALIITPGREKQL